MSGAIANLIAIIFCAGGLGLVLFAFIVARTELEQRLADAATPRKRQRRRSRR